MSERANNSFRDVLTAMLRLSPQNPATEQAIARMLGYQPEHADAASFKEADRKIDTGDTAPWRKSEESVKTHENVGEQETNPFPIALDEVEQKRSAQPFWDGVQSLEKPDKDRRAKPPEPDPIFKPGWKRHLLCTLSEIQREEGDVDLSRIVRDISRGKALATLPRQPIPTLGRGVQLLLDRSEAMMPFYKDLEQFQQEMTRYIGSDRVDVLKFDGCPTRGAGKGPKFRWTEYAATHAPPAQTPVICVTDLGIGRVIGGTGPATQEEWLDFSRLLARASCPLVCLVPYAKDRRPSGLAKKIDIVFWDRHTSVSQIARIVRRHNFVHK